MKIPLVVDLFLTARNAHAFTYEETKCSGSPVNSRWKESWEWRHLREGSSAKVRVLAHEGKQSEDSMTCNYLCIKFLILDIFRSWRTWSV